MLDTIWGIIAPTTPSEFWSMVGGLGAIAVAVVAGRGLRSLRLSRADISTRVQRDARGSAVRRCEELADEIIPMNRPLSSAIAQSKIAMFVKDASGAQFDPDDPKQVKAAEEWVKKLPNEVVREAVRFLNRLEAWSVYFTSGLAEHEIAFGPCAPVYCSLIVQHYPILLLLRSRSTSGKYPNAVKLFQGWRDLLEQQNRGLKQEDLLKQLKELQSAPKKGSHLPSPLGTDLDA